MALTEAQLNRIRRLIGDHSDPSSFTDDELNAYYTDLSEDFDKTIVECFDVLLADAAKRTTYRQGSSYEDDNKLFEHLEKLRKLWAAHAGVGAGPVKTGTITYEFYDQDGTAIPEDTSELDASGWIW